MITGAKTLWIIESEKTEFREHIQAEAKTLNTQQERKHFGSLRAKKLISKNI